MKLKYKLTLAGILVLSYFVFPTSRALAAPTNVTSGSSDVTLPDDSTVDVTVDTTSTGSNRILIVQISFRNSGANSVDGITYNGVAMTSFGAQVESVQATNQLWYLLAPTTGSNTLTVDMNNSAGSVPGSVSWMVFSDVDQATPYDGYTSNTGVDDSMELTVTSAVGDTPFFTATWRGNGATGVTPTNYTDRVDNVYSAGNGLAASGEGTGAASVAFVGTVDGEFVNTGWTALGANLNASSGSVVRRGLMRAVSGFNRIRNGFLRIGR